MSSQQPVDPPDEASASEPAASADTAPADAAAGGLAHLDVETIEPNPHQPREAFDEETLATLAASIAEAGVMQPIVVRRASDGYQLVAGERRWRAARKAGLDRVPAVIHDLSDAETAQWALVENLQREDLDPIERARAFEHLAQEFDWTHGQIAEQIGVSRAAVSNSLRLLSLPDEIRELIQAGSLSEGQAKVLAGIETPARQLKLARRAADEGWSVRALENAAKPARPEGDGGGAESSGGSDSSSRPPQLVDLERQISEQLQTKVQLKTGRKKGSGSLTIKFYSLDQFDGLLERLGVETD